MDLLTFFFLFFSFSRDYDDWKLPGWSTEELLPLMRRLESFDAWDAAGDETHGNEGPIAVSYGGYNEEQIIADGLKSARELGHSAADHGKGVDTNNLKTANGFMVR
jgi:alcohol oxidase